MDGMVRLTWVVVVLLASNHLQPITHAHAQPQRSSHTHPHRHRTNHPATPTHNTSHPLTPTPTPTPHHTPTLHYTTLHHTTPHYTTPLHHTTLHYTTPHYTTPYHTTYTTSTHLRYHISKPIVSLLLFLRVGQLRVAAAHLPLPYDLYGPPVEKLCIPSTLALHHITSHRIA